MKNLIYREIRIGEFAAFYARNKGIFFPNFSICPSYSCIIIRRISNVTITYSSFSGLFGFIRQKNDF